MTREELNSPLWRLSNLYFIGTPDGRKILFSPNPAQQLFITAHTGRDIILKARQLGFTTLLCLVSLDEVLFRKNHNAAIIAHTREAAVRIFEDKVKFPYQNLPDWLRALRPATTDKSGMLSFGHGCSICVTTSTRSMTVQRLHISEFGKICNNNPGKAREIVTGAFPAVGKNPITIESTAEGQEGYFYKYCTDAMAGRGLFQFHFFPWWADIGNSVPVSSAVVTQEHEAYFEKVSNDHNVSFTEGQKNWWVEQEYLLGADMKRENPSSPTEAFEQALEGAYFSRQLMWLERRECIGRFIPDLSYPVHTFWDLGINDMTTIWFMQHIKGRFRFINYYENSGESISHYINHLAEWCRTNDLQPGDVYWPHDGGRKDLFLPSGRLGVADELNINPVIVPRIPNKMDAIESARKIMTECDFNEGYCSVGLKRLRHYRKIWDAQKSVFQNKPVHDINSHAADAFMVFACGYRDFKTSKVSQRTLDNHDAGWTPV